MKRQDEKLRSDQLATMRAMCGVYGTALLLSCDDGATAWSAVSISSMAAAVVTRSRVGCDWAECQRAQATVRPTFNQAN